MAHMFSPVCYGPYDMDDMVWTRPYGINDNTSIRLADNSIVIDSFPKNNQLVMSFIRKVFLN